MSPALKRPKRSDTDGIAGCDAGENTLAHAHTHTDTQKETSIRNEATRESEVRGLERLDGASREREHGEAHEAGAAVR